MTRHVDDEHRPAAPLDARLSACREVLRQIGRPVVAFSAGVDSTYLLALAADTLGADSVLAAVGVSPSLPRRELEAARGLAAHLGVELAEVPTGELADPRYAANPAERCYYCKRDLFTRLVSLTQERGFNAVISGANADDAGDFRPGLRAGRELGVRNPLQDAGLTKADVRDLSRRLGLPTWNKPAMACLASRVPYGDPITVDVLRRIEAAEDGLKSLGFIASRVRSHGPVARIELPADDLARALPCRHEIVAAVESAGFRYVCLDLKGLRSGSMNEVLTDEERTVGVRTNGAGSAPGRTRE